MRGKRRSLPERRVGHQGTARSVLLLLIAFFDHELSCLLFVFLFFLYFHSPRLALVNYLTKDRQAG